MSHPLLERLQDPDRQVRAEACRALAEDPSAVLFLDALADALADPEREVGRAASDALVRLADRHPEVHAVLRRSLHEDDPQLRFRAAYTQARLGPPEPGLLPALVEAFAARDADVRWAAIRIFVDLGRNHGEALTVAIGLARTADAGAVRRSALFCLRELAPDDPAVADVFIEASRHADPEVRRAALTSMAALLAPKPDVAERLLAVLADAADPAAQRLAAIALGELSARAPDPETQVALASIVSSAADPHLVRAAAHAIARSRLGLRDYHPSPGSEDESV